MKNFRLLYMHILMWIRHHLILSSALVIVIAVLIWASGPVSFAATHMSMRNCGDLYNGYGPGISQYNPVAQQDIQCFVQAHQQCQAASISYTQHSIDTGTTYTYYTANALGNCSLSVQDDSFVDVMPHRISSYACSSLASKSDGLHILSCGNNGDMLIPFHALKA